MREPKGIANWIIILLALALASFHVYTGMMGIMESRIQRGVHLLFVVPLAFLLYPATKRSSTDIIPWYDWVLAVVAAIPSLYVVFYREVLNSRWENTTPVTTLQIVLGIIIILSLIEAVRRAAAPALAVLMIIAMLELIFGHLIPGSFGHRKLGIERIIEISYMLGEEGIYGYVTGISAVFVALFVIFGSFINAVGLGEYFIKLAYRIAGRSTGGPAKVAVMASGFFGTISGAAVANVAATGVFTIPLMKKTGYRPQFAGAVEAAASTGGGLVPPIMGAAVFLMAQITQIPYITICITALPTAIFYYTCVFFTVHFEAKKFGLVVKKDSDTIEVIPWKTLIKSSYLLLPILVLLFYLLIGYSPMKASFYGILSCVVIGIINLKKNFNLQLLLRALVGGGKSIVMIGCACSGAGLIVSVITNTGIGLSFSSLVINLSHGNILIALALIMSSSIVLGMGLPTTAAYVLTIAIGGPVLIELGGNILAVHLFVFYFSVLAAVTPPVAMAAYAGASIAGSPAMSTAFEASRIAIAGYIVPYLFFFNNGILLYGDLSNIVLSITLAAIGILFICVGLEGWMITKVFWPERIVLILLSILIPFPIMPNKVSLIVGFTFLALLLIVQKKRDHKIKLQT